MLQIIAGVLFIIWLIGLLLGSKSFIHVLLLTSLAIASVWLVRYRRERQRD